MTKEQVKEQALILAAMYAFLDQDRSTPCYHVDKHNICSAYIEYPDKSTETFFCYSNPSALKAKKIADYNFVVDADITKKLINRRGMIDLHTEVRLINYLYSKDKLKPNTVVNFFSSRSVCDTCRAAIYDTMRKLSGQVAFMAYEFKAEKSGFTKFIYPITEHNRSQYGIDYEA